RAGEFLAGVALALVLDRHGGTVPVEWQRAVRGIGAAALTGLAAVMLLVDREIAWLYQGGLGLFALPAVAVIAAAGLPGSAVARVLGRAPLAALGRAAFSIYVVHWPLFVLARRTLPLDGVALVSVELAVALVAGFWLHRHVETPLLANGAGTRLGPVLTDRRV